MKVASTKLANPDWEALQNKCNEQGVTIAEYLRGLIRTDSKKTTLREVQEGTEQEVVNESKHAEPTRTSGLAWLSGKKPSVTSKGLSDTQSPVEDVRQEVRKQWGIIQSMASQLKEMKEKVDEQIERQAVQPRPDATPAS